MIVGCDRIESLSLLSGMCGTWHFLAGCVSMWLGEVKLIQFLQVIIDNGCFAKGRGCDYVLTRQGTPDFQFPVHGEDTHG